MYRIVKVDESTYRKSMKAGRGGCSIRLWCREEGIYKMYICVFLRDVNSEGWR